ncbi:MAG: energy transducer TonB [Pyrinomonadaceae bacterium]
MKLSLTKFLFFLFILLMVGQVSFAQSSRAKRNPGSTVNNADKPLNITFRPEPVVTDDLQKQIGEREATVKLRVEFLDSGLIGAITPIESAPEGLTAAAVEAAGRIKFEPEKKNGRPVTVYQVVEYSFSPPEKEVEKIDPENLAKARAIVGRAVEKLGGAKYLGVKTQIGRGKFSIIRDGVNVSFQSFTDVIVYPDREITELKQRGVKTVQSNYGDAGWLFDGSVEKLSDQSADQVGNFRRSMRINLDNFLRGNWREAQLSYVGRRQAGLGRRNDVVRLAFDDGFAVEFEFSDEGIPMKSVYSRVGPEGKEILEEDRFAQFIDIEGIKTPFIIDHFTNDVHISRVNYQSVEFNRPVSAEVFAKPDNIKALKKDLKP